MAGSMATSEVPVVRRRRRRSMAERVLDAFLFHAIKRRPDGRLNVEGALDRASESNPIAFIKLALALEDFEAELEAEAATPPFDLHVRYIVALMDGGPGAIDDEGRIVPVGREAAP